MKRVMCLLLVMLVLFSGCGSPKVEEDYGSFTVTKSYSYDEKYYVTLTKFDNNDGINITVLDIRLTENDMIKDSIVTGESVDFWGYCWEEDSYNIWVQSAETGVSCYVFDGLISWELDETSEKPDYIVTKPQ